MKIYLNMDTRCGIDNLKYIGFILVSAYLPMIQWVRSSFCVYSPLLPPSTWLRFCSDNLLSPTVAIRSRRDVLIPRTAASGSQTHIVNQIIPKLGVSSCSLAPKWFLFDFLKGRVKENSQPGSPGAGSQVSQPPAPPSRFPQLP